LTELVEDGRKLSNCCYANRMQIISGCDLFFLCEKCDETWD